MDISRAWYLGTLWYVEPNPLYLSWKLYSLYDLVTSPWNPGESDVHRKGVTDDHKEYLFVRRYNNVIFHFPVKQ